MSQFDQQQFQDQTLTCRDCSNPFVFEVGEQKFFAEKSLTAPVRCKPCRALKKASRDQGGSGGGNFRSAPAASQQQPTSFDSPPRDSSSDGRRPKNGKGGRRNRNDDWSNRRGGNYDD